jgi:hypothetical protein
MFILNGEMATVNALKVTLNATLDKLYILIIIFSYLNVYIFCKIFCERLTF